MGRPRNLVWLSKTGLYPKSNSRGKFQRQDVLQFYFAGISPCIFSFQFACVCKILRSGIWGFGFWKLIAHTGAVLSKIQSATKRVAIDALSLTQQ